MGTVWLVTAKDTNIHYGDSLYVEGAFSSKAKAVEYVNLMVDEDASVFYIETPMTVDYPASDLDSKGENDYPSAYYAE